MKWNRKIINDIFFQPIKINKTFWVIFLIICSLSAGAFSFYKAVKRVGQPFGGFFIGENLMVSVGQRANWPGVEAGLKPLDKIIAVNGIKLNNAEHLKDIVRFARIDDAFSYRIERAGQIKNILVPIKRISAWDFLISFLAPFSIGLIFITLGAITIFYVPDLRVSYLYFVLCSLIGIYCLVVFESYTSHTFFRFTQIYPFIAAVAVHLFAIFKEDRRITEARSFIVVSVYFLSLIIVSLREYFLFNQDITIVLSKISSFFVAFTLLINLGLIIDNLISAKTNVAKDRAKVLLAGVIIASSAVGLWSTNFVYKRALFYLDEAILISLIFPIFMTYAILKKNIFDIDRVIRTSLTYAVSMGLVILSYFIIMAMVGFIWPGVMQPEGLIGVFAFLAIIGAFVFKPLIKKVQILIYKVLFRAKYDRLQTLMNFAKKLSSGGDLDEVSRLMVSDLADLMDLKGAFLLTYISETKDHPLIQRADGFNPENLDLRRYEKNSSVFVSTLSSFDKPQFLGDLSNIRTRKDVDRLKEMGIKIIVPIKSRSELLGILFLMEKASKDIFTAEDLDFLGALSDQSAISLENAKLYVEKAKQERLAAIGQVASVIIHEIKNPLGVIKVSSGIIRRKSDEDNPNRELATFIEKEVDRVNTTIQQILNFSKPKENRLSQFSLDMLVSDTLNDIERLGLGKKIKITRNLKAGDEKIVADSEKIRRTLLNLVLNAAQAVEPGGKIHIETKIAPCTDSVCPECVEISVEDDGEGIDDVNLKYIMQPFYTTRQEGTGLGLSIVKQIIEDHDGSIVVDSKKGKGSVFRLQFPRKTGTIKNGEIRWTQIKNTEL